MNNTAELTYPKTEVSKKVFNLSSVAFAGGDDFEKHESLLTGNIYASKKIPPLHSLSQNTVNPFKVTTEIKFGLPRSGKVLLRLYDVENGKVVIALDEETMRAGIHTYTFNTCELLPGKYYYSLVADDMLISIKQLLLRK